MKAVAAAVAAAALTENAYNSSSAAAKTPSSTVRSRFAEQHPAPSRSSSSLSVPVDALQQPTGAYSSKQQPSMHNSSTNSSLNSSSSGTPAAVLTHTGSNAVPHNAAATAAVNSYSSTGSSKQLHAAPLQRSSPPAGSSSTDKLSLSFTKQDPTPLQSIAEVPSPGEQCGGESPDTGASLWPYISTTAANATAAASAAGATHNSSMLNSSVLNTSACSSSCSSHGGSTSSSSTGCLTAGGSAVRPCANSGGSAEAPTSSSSSSAAFVAAPAAALPTHRRAHSGHSPGSESGYGESPSGLHSAFSRLLSTDNVVEVNGIPYVRMDCIGRGGSSKVCALATTTPYFYTQSV
jgi:hypothetical protein